MGFVADRIVAGRMEVGTCIGQASSPRRAPGGRPWKSALVGEICPALCREAEKKGCETARMACAEPRETEVHIAVRVHACVRALAGVYAWNRAPWHMWFTGVVQERFGQQHGMRVQMECAETRV